MFLSSHEIARSREHALNNLLDFSAACIEAGQRFSELVSANGREAVHHGSRNFAQVSHGQLETLTQFPATVWLENSARASRLIDSTLEIIGEANKAMIRSTESHVRMIDEMIFAALNRVTRTSPWEAEFALHAMKNSLESAEQGLHGISEAAIKTVTLAEKEIHEAAGILAAGTPAPRHRTTPVKKPAAT
jgi:hypothetical protein